VTAVAKAPACGGHHRARGSEPLQVERPTSGSGRFVGRESSCRGRRCRVSRQPHVRGITTSAGASPGATAPWAALDTRGIIAWDAWDMVMPAAHGVAVHRRKWNELTTRSLGRQDPSAVPLRDAQRAAAETAGDEKTQVSMAIVPLESVGIDGHHVEEQVRPAVGTPTGEARCGYLKGLVAGSGVVAVARTVGR